MVDWKKVKFFKESEGWGDPSKMNPDLIYELDNFREYVKTPIVISSGFRPGQGTSYHHKGMAVDIVFPKKKLVDIPDLFFQALRFKFNGVGVYSFWSYAGRVCGGLHLDIRPTVPFRMIWLSASQNKYESVDFQRFKDLFR